MSAVSDIKGLANSQHATAGLYILVAGLALSDIVPTFADFLVFKEQRKLRDQYFNNEISPKVYWEKSAWAYYTYNFVYWVIVGIIIVSIKGDFQTKAKWLFGIIGAGAVIAVLYGNIKKDEKEKALQQELLIPKQ